MSDRIEDSIGKMPTLGHAETVWAQQEPVWHPDESIGELMTLKAGGIVDDRRTDGARRWKAGEEILGRYVVERELGQGGMGVVYECFDKTGGVKVAVKCLPPELSHSCVEMEEVRENFQLVVGLRHSNIAGVRTLEKDANGVCYLVMDVAEGENLRTWLRRKWKEGGVSLEEAVGVLRQVAAALDYAHGEKVIHRDVKPGNVMLDGRGRVKVLDFGLAAQIRTSLSRASHVYRGTSGTGPYMAPEQWEGQPQDGAADQYALGVMAYEMLAGRLPFENSELAVLREVVRHGAVRDIPGVDKRAMGALRRALAKRAEERWESCGAFVEALAGKRRARSGRRSARGKTLMGWVATLGVLVALAWWVGWGRENAGGPPALRQGAVARPEDVPHQGSRAGDRMTVRVGVREVALRWCPADTFTMGTPEREGLFREETQHRVTLTRGFWMGETEVTQGLWQEVMGDNPSYFKSGDNYPVEQVSWEDCQEFVQALNSRYPQDGLLWALPTEAQWEYACRAGRETALPNGNTLRILGENNAPALDDIAWYGGNSSVNYIGRNGVDTSGWTEKQYPGGEAGTHPVAGKKANSWGLYDMIGNVGEWCADWYGPYPSNPVAEPPGPMEGSGRVGRGGSWSDYARFCRSADRGSFAPDCRGNYLGLRVALLPVQ